MSGYTPENTYGSSTDVVPWHPNLAEAKLIEMLRNGEEVTEEDITELLEEDDEARRSFGLDPLDFQAAREHLERIGEGVQERPERRKENPNLR